MGLDVLKTGLDLLSGGTDKAPGAAEGAGNGIMGKIMEFAKGKPEVAQDAVPKAQEVAREAKAERFGFFKEAIQSVLIRQAPRAMLFWDIYEAGKEAKDIFYGSEVKDEKGNIKRVKKSIDQFTLQRALMGISSLLVLVPGDWKHCITDLFANSSVFQSMVDWWPGMDGIIDIPYLQKYLDMELPVFGVKGGPLRERVKNKEPNAILLAMRIMAQDLFTGKVAFDKVKEMLGGSGVGAAAALAAGGGALALGAKALGGETPGGGLLGGLSEALGGKPKGKKLLELVKAHPEQMPTDMQKNLLALLQQMKVAESAELIKGDWNDNNDYCTVSYVYNNGIYYLEFDNDVSGTDIKVNNASGQMIANFTDWSTFNPDDDSDKIIAAMKANPSATLNPPAAPATTPVAAPASASTGNPANDNATPAAADKKAA
jgi:hypothetical protein